MLEAECRCLLAVPYERSGRGVLKRRYQYRYRGFAHVRGVVCVCEVKSVAVKVDGVIYRYCSFAFFPPIPGWVKDGGVYNSQGGFGPGSGVSGNLEISCTSTRGSVKIGKLFLLIHTNLYAYVFRFLMTPPSVYILPLVNRYQY